MASVYRSRELVYLAIVFFFYFSSIGCLAPFLTSHMKHLGFSLPEVSFINAVAAFVSMIGPVIGGLIADRCRKHKAVTIISIFFGGVAFCVLAFVPSSQRLHYQPLVDFSCRSGLRVERCVNWATCLDTFSFKNSTTIQLTDCRYYCRRGSDGSLTQPLHICFHGLPGNICIVHDSESGNASAAEFDTKLSTWPFKEHSKESNDYFTNGDINLTLKSAAHDVFDPSWLDKEQTSNRDRLRANVAMCHYRPHSPIILNQKNYESISCRPMFDGCDIHCRVSFTSGGTFLTPNSCEESNGSPSITFWSYITLRCLGDLCLLTAICLLDAMVVSSTSDFEGAYGRMHVWPVLGISSFAPFSGALMDHFVDLDGKPNFFPPIFVAAGLAVLTCALVIALPIYTEKPQEPKKTEKSEKSECESSARTRKLLSFELFMFLVIVIILGMQWGVMFTFLPYLTTDIGCSGMMTGLGYTMVFGCCLPFLLISKNLVRNIGRANLLVFALLFYGTRYAGVSYVFSPWWTLPFAAMGAFTICVMWIASVAYGQYLAPLGYNKAMQYVLNLLHFGIGRGIGSLLGGTLISHHGLRTVFRGVAVFSAGIGFLYLAIYQMGIRRKRVRRRSKCRTMNGSWVLLQEHRPNGDAIVNQTALADEENDSDLDNDAASTK